MPARPTGAAIEARVHAVAVEFDFVQPFDGGGRSLPAAPLIGLRPKRKMRRG
jgi:hypothetical protein